MKDKIKNTAKYFHMLFFDLENGGLARAGTVFRASPARPFYSVLLLKSRDPRAPCFSKKVTKVTQ